MWKSLLVHLDASPRAAVRVALAQALARHQGAELTALYGVLPALLATPWAVAQARGLRSGWWRNQSALRSGYQVQQATAPTVSSAPRA